MKKRCLLHQLLASTDMAIIPTEWNTEIQCWEIKGKTSENDFIVYINVETGEVDDDAAGAGAVNAGATG